MYVILDSVDNMYNLIDNLYNLIDNLPREEIKQLCSQFTVGVTYIIVEENEKIITFCFGVSPYPIPEYWKYAISCHLIGSTSNELDKYFSYSDASIHVHSSYDS